MMSFIRDIYKIKQEIGNEIANLREYSNAFHITGNEKMKNKLYKSANKLNVINKRLEAVINDKLDIDLEEARKSSKKVFEKYVKPHLSKQH